jgi:hypothetical protein
MMKQASPSDRSGDGVDLTENIQGSEPKGMMVILSPRWGWFSAVDGTHG